MRTLLSIVLMLVVVASVGARTYPPAQEQPQSGVMTADERKALLDQLTQTRQGFLDSLKGVTAAEWRFKPGPFSWSLAEVSEHIVVSEDFLFGISQQTLKTPAQAKRSGVPDQGLLSRVADRSQKALNPDAIAPKGKYATPAEAIADFTAARDRSIQYAKTTNDDLRAHFSANGLDAYQFLLLMAAHSGRHTKQILEVKANPKYPPA